MIAVENMNIALKDNACHSYMRPYCLSTGLDLGAILLDNDKKDLQGFIISETFYLMQKEEKIYFILS